MLKRTSLPCNMHKLYVNCCDSKSFCDFQQLILRGQQSLLSYGQYCDKPGTKENRRKMIYYTYSKL